MCCWFLCIVFYDLWRSGFFFSRKVQQSMYRQVFPGAAKSHILVSVGFSRACASPEQWALRWYQNTSNASQATKLPFHFTLLSKLDQLGKYIFSKRLFFLISYHKAAISFSDSIFKRAVPDVSLWCRVPVLAYSVGTDWLEGKGDPWPCHKANAHAVQTKLFFFQWFCYFSYRSHDLWKWAFPGEMLWKLWGLQIMT